MKWEGSRQEGCMDLTVLTASYPVVEELIKRSPQVRKWFEKKATEEDPAFLLQLQPLQATRESLQATREVGQAMADLRRYTLLTSIMSAKLANPKLSPEDIKRESIQSVEVATQVQAALEQISVPSP